MGKVSQTPWILGHDRGEGITTYPLGGAVWFNPPPLRVYHHGSYARGLITGESVSRGGYLIYVS